MNMSSPNRSAELPRERAMAPTAGAAFSIMNPHGGEIYRVGSKVAIYWTGGPELPQTIRIGLIDRTAWVEAIEITSQEPISTSPGFYQWQIPVNFVADPTHEYEIYVQAAVGSGGWIYGSSFRIVV